MPVPWLCHLLAGQTWAHYLAKVSIFSCKNEDDKPDLIVRIKGENASKRATLKSGQIMRLMTMIVTCFTNSGLSTAEEEKL